MAYIITEPCIGVKDKGCVAVCPVDCIQEGSVEHEGKTYDMLFIDPGLCIDCGLCVDERGGGNWIEGPRRGGPKELAEWVQATEATLVIPTK